MGICGVDEKLNNPSKKGLAKINSRFTPWKICKMQIYINTKETTEKEIGQ